MSGFNLERLRESMESIGQIYPVIKDQYGNILDGFHRKRVNPNWKECVVEVKDELDVIKIRLHAHLRREVPWNEKHEWIIKAKEILTRKLGREPSQQEIADALGLSRELVKYYLGGENENVGKIYQHSFWCYNVWGFKDDSWRKLVVSADPNQPDINFYHGATPAFVIENLIHLYKPKIVLDSMAGVGTTGYVCAKYGIECDQFDIYPFEKHGVKQCDAEYVDTGKKYDLIFNHIPYLDMVKYGDHEQDLSNMNEKEFMEKLKRIFLKNYTLLNEDGVYAVLVGDRRYGGKIIPLTAKVTLLGLECGFILYDEAIKLTKEQKSTAIQEHRAAKHGYMAQTYDTILIFKKG